MTFDFDHAARHEPQSTAHRDTITIAEMLDAYDHWGVPHFQRGSVWGPDNVSALLESLYHDTPCGSIILWTPENISEYGVPLLSGRPFTHLIIDGQQRTRSIYAAFKGLLDETVDQSEEPDDIPQSSSSDSVPERCWAINLHEVREFEDLLGVPGKRLWPLFVSIPDPHAAEERRLREEDARRARKVRWNIPESQFKYNFVPLEYFNGSDFASLLKECRFFLKRGMGNPSDVAPVVERLEGLRRKVHEMQRRPLFLKKLGRDVTLETALQVFVRINSGGRPVQEEEKGFSVLVGKYQSTATWVRHIFEWVHDAWQPDGLEQRDEALKRMNERQFGFRLFIRVFVLTVTYHTHRALTSRGLSFAILRDRRFLPTLEGDRQTYDQFWSITADAVVAMRSLLEKGLGLDAIRFLPETTSLLPLFLWLIRYPGALEATGGNGQAALRPEFEAGAARLTLLLLLKDPTKRKMMNLATMVATVQKDAASVLDQLQREVSVTTEFLDNELQDANSLTNRYTLLLYALERSRNARDFDYSKNGLFGNGFSQEARGLANACRPEKQHIIPYSRLIELYDLASKSRISSTEANNIGNITYVSRAQNRELVDTPTNLAGEDPTNLTAHLIDKPALAAYEHVRQLLELQDGAPAERLKEAYRGWIEARRAVITAGLSEWLAVLDRQWKGTFARLQATRRLEPVAPMLASPSVPYLLRALDLPDPIEDELIKLFGDGNWKIETKAGEPLQISSTIVLFFEQNRGRAIRDVEISPSHLTCLRRGRCQQGRSI